MSPADPVLRAVVDRELALLDPAVRSSREGLEALLHPDFVEIGSAGDRWHRETIVALLSGLGPSAHPPIDVADVRASHVTDDVVLVVYETAHAGERAARSTVWRREGDDWRAVFHQGTPLPAKGPPRF
jgi:ribonuclease HI